MGLVSQPIPVQRRMTGPAGHLHKLFQGGLANWLILLLAWWKGKKKINLELFAILWSKYRPGLCGFLKKQGFCSCVNVCDHVCVYLHANVHVFMCVCIRASVWCVWARMWVCMCVYMCVNMHACIHVYVYVHACVNVYTCVAPFKSRFACQSLKITFWLSSWDYFKMPLLPQAFPCKGAQGYLMQKAGGGGGMGDGKTQTYSDCS